MNTTISIRGNPERQIADIRRNFPQEYKRAMIAVAMGLKKKATQILSGNGPVSVQPLNKETLEIRKARGQSRSRKMGGKLRTSIKAYAKGGRTYASWPERLRRIGEQFQNSDSHKRTKNERHLLYSYGIKDFSKTYARPSRPIWKRLSKWRGLQAYIRDAIVKRINAMISKNGGR